MIMNAPAPAFVAAGKDAAAAADATVCCRCCCTRARARVPLPIIPRREGMCLHKSLRPTPLRPCAPVPVQNPLPCCPSAPLHP